MDNYEWKDVDGFEGVYRMNNDKVVQYYSITKKKWIDKKPQITKSGKERIRFTKKDGKYICRLLDLLYKDMFQGIDSFPSRKWEDVV